MILGSHLLAEAATTPLSNSPPRSPPRSAANSKPREFSNTAMRRTLTNLYNERPAWLAHAHAALDAAVATAYDWPADLTDQEILARLLERNRGGG